ncbi:hypothetical protein VTI74DRAFT_5192 [Chaetomium olivicolor]
MLPASQGPAAPNHKPTIKTAPDRETEIKPWSSAPPRVPCTGPRGLEVGQDNDDNLHESAIDIPYPRPFVGSYETIGLSQTWMTADDRYGPYGWGEDQPTYNKKKVAWNATDWAMLQNQCLERNAHRFRHPAPIRPGEPRFRLRGAGEEVEAPVIEQQAAEHVPRTAIIFRAWEGYNYTTEDLVNLRATTTETALRFGGEYTVFILVDVKDENRKIFDSDENYRRAIRELVPPEFQNMTVLFDETLLESWYPKVKSHSPTYQIMQPLQLFGQFYPEFDHYWQLELDVRFTGHAGRFLAAMSNFAREQPRKQAIERSTWFYMPEFHHNYSDLLAAVNASLEGKGGLQWGMRIEDFEPLGPKPPVGDALDDNFEWGVGDEADFIALLPCANIPYLKDWYWRNWRHGFKAGTKNSGWMCQPAMGRASRILLRAVHHAQATKGLAIHSEATLSSFALWHGLKLVAPPHPMYQDPQWPRDKMDELFNGPGAIEAHREQGMVGMANGAAIYRQSPYDYITNSGSFWWNSSFPGRIYDAWLSRGRQDQNNSHDVPYVLWRSENGSIYAPNMLLHPVKTNRNLPEQSGLILIAAIVAAVVLLCILTAGFWWWRKRWNRSGYRPLNREQCELDGIQVSSAAGD